MSAVKGSICSMKVPLICPGLGWASLLTIMGPYGSFTKSTLQSTHGRENECNVISVQKWLRAMLRTYGTGCRQKGRVHTLQRSEGKKRVERATNTCSCGAHIRTSLHANELTV